jgi:hypothetical protein
LRAELAQLGRVRIGKLAAVLSVPLLHAIPGAFGRFVEVSAGKDTKTLTGITFKSDCRIWFLGKQLKPDFDPGTWESLADMAVTTAQLLGIH